MVIQRVELKVQSGGFRSSFGRFFFPNPTKSNLLDFRIKYHLVLDWFFIKEEL